MDHRKQKMDLGVIFGEFPLCQIVILRYIGGISQKTLHLPEGSVLPSLARSMVVS